MELITWKTIKIPKGSRTSSHRAGRQVLRNQTFGTTGITGKKLRSQQGKQRLPGGEKAGFEGMLHGETSGQSVRICNDGTAIC